MTATEQRFALEYRAPAEDEPGLVLEDDGSVWVVRPGGARFQIVQGGGGGGLAGVTSEVASGQVIVTPDDTVGPSGTIIVQGTADGSSVLSSPSENTIVLVTDSPPNNVQIAAEHGMLIQSPAATILLDDTAGIEFSGTGMGFFGVPAQPRPDAPSSAQELYEGLVSLGLIAPGGTIIESAFAPITIPVDVTGDHVVLSDLETTGARFLTYQQFDDLVFASSAHMDIGAIAFTQYPTGPWMAAPTLGNVILVGLAQLSGDTAYPAQIPFPLAGPVVGTTTTIVLSSIAQDGIRSSTMLFDDGGGNTLELFGMTGTSFDELVSIQIVDPGVNNHALRAYFLEDEIITGGWILTVELGTDGAGAIVSTWIDVQSVVNYVLGSQTTGSLNGVVASPVPKLQMSASNPGTVSTWTATLHLV